MAGGNSSTVWSGCSGGWDDHQSKIHCLLDNDRTRSIFYRKRGRCADGTISCQPPWSRACPWLSDVLLCHPGILEGAWSHCHTRASFSAAQGMGVCRHLLRPDRRSRILRCCRWLWRFRLSHYRPARHCWSYCGVVGAATTEPCHRRPLSCDKRPAGIDTAAPDALPIERSLYG